MDAELQTAVEEHLDLVRRFFADHGPALVRLASELSRVLRQGQKILFFGNGGSAADAQHLAAELVGRFERERPGLAALALTTDTSALTAIGNDFGFEALFARQVESLGTPGDACVALSTSGNSPNLLEAVRAARTKGMITAGLLGKDGGALRHMVDFPLIVPGTRTARIQEVHILAGHLLCQAIERDLFPARD